MHNFKELKVWKDSMDLANKVYAITRLFPDEEKFVLTSQIMRSVISIPSNIAEGAGRNSKKEFFHFLNFALGSAFELETQIILANNFDYIKSERFEGLVSKISKVQKMLYGLQKSL